MTTQHLTQQLLAKRWNVSIRTLERWRTEGIGPNYLKIHASVMYREIDILEYEQSCLRISTSGQAVP